MSGICWHAGKPAAQHSRARLCKQLLQRRRDDAPEMAQIMAVPHQGTTAAAQYCRGLQCVGTACSLNLPRKDIRMKHAMNPESAPHWQILQLRLASHLNSLKDAAHTMLQRAVGNVCCLYHCHLHVCSGSCLKVLTKQAGMSTIRAGHKLPCTSKQHATEQRISERIPGHCQRPA